MTVTKLDLRFRALVLGMISYTLVLLIALPAQADSSFTFTAIGDTPYSDADNAALQSEIPDAIKAAQPPFVVHYGDLLAGGESCSEALLQERRDQAYDLLPGRVFYTPGDNEWTDCDRTYHDPPVSELGELDRVRRTFFPAPLDIPKTWAYTTQPNYPENARWIYNGVLFATLHMTGTNNGRTEILEDDVDYALATVEARDQANRVWLDAAFKAALKAKAKAVVIVTQADVTNWGSGACTPYNRTSCDAFETFRAQIRRNASGFRDRGQPRRPVLLLHGDTNPYCWDKRFGGKTAQNLWRLNGWGDYQSPPDATQITIDPTNEKAPFQVQTLIHNQVPTKRCSPFN